jgi:hypothetical protein
MRSHLQPRFSRKVHRRQETIPSAVRSLADLLQDRPLLGSVSQWQRRRRFRQALAGAYGRFSARNPQWSRALFDEHFLSGRASPYLVAYGRGEAERDPAALATLWADQMSPRAERRQRRIRSMMPAAACFLNLLDAELGRAGQRSF